MPVDVDPIEVNPNEESPVIFDIETVPYQNLSDYNFFEGELSDQNPVYGVLPYDLISPLFSDYASKKRFVWMPKNVKANYVNDYSPLDFPTGSILIKSFYYENVLPNNSKKIIETRLMIKKDEAWIFANYLWNDEQTNAVLTTQGSFANFDWKHNGETKSVAYKVPSFSECFTCHNQNESPFPIGPKPQNLNRDITYVSGVKNQLDKWVEMGYLSETYPSNIDTTVRWDDALQPLNLRARSYLDINCAHCHADNRYCEYVPIRFDFESTTAPENLGICVNGTFVFDDAMLTIVNPGNPQKSILYNRINTDDPVIRMPLLSRSLIHKEGIQLIEDWITSLTNCD